MPGFDDLNPEQNTADDNLLGDMDPMAWLESLAKRQGATTGFTTDANIDVPEVDPNTVVIDEPGYVPYEGSKSAKALAAQPPAPTPPPPPAEPVYDASAYQQYDESAYQQAYDPSQYGQDQYAYQQAYDQSGYQQPQEAPPEPAAAFDPSMGLPEGVDPMAWLESLAKRQGADSGFTTAADMSIPEVDPNTVVIDEPGYVPYEGSKSAKALAAQPPAVAPAPPPPPAEPVYDASAYQQYDESAYQQAYDPSQYGQDQYAYQQAYDQSGYQQPQEAALPAAAFDPSTGLPDDVDPMAWLESLAARQGATTGFTTDHNLEVAEIDPNSVVIDEPGYVPYEGSKSAKALAAQPPAPTPPPPAPIPEPAAAQSTESFLDSMTLGAGEMSSLDDSTSWLDSLVQESGAGVADFLTTSPEEEFLPGFDLASMEAVAPPLEEAIPATHTPEQIAESIEGLSDEDIARRQVAGQLTPEQEFAWIQLQAKRLREAREVEEAMEVPISMEDLTPAEATEIPPWLQQNVVITEEKEPTSAFISDLETPADDLSWLAEEPAAEASIDLGFSEFAQETPGLPTQPTNQGFIPGDELADFLELEAYDPSVDEWAEALDAEHDRIASGSSTQEMAWFNQAMQSVEAEPAVAAPVEPAMPEFSFEPEPAAPAIPSDMPDWLAAVAEDVAATSVTEEVPEDLPDWLRPVAAASAAAGPSGDIGEWLRQEESAPAFAPPPTVAQPTPAAPSQPAPGATLPSAASERFTAAQEGALPSWAEQPPAVAATPTAMPPTRPAAAPPPPRPAVPPPPPRVAAPPPQPSQERRPIPVQPIPSPRSPALVPAEFAQFKAQLDQNPGDHAARLGLARAMSQSGDVGGSLQQYETLVDQHAKLEDVTTDLIALIERNPQHPAARRVLGDVYMHQGYLQEALDAYRGALDNL